MRPAPKGLRSFSATVHGGGLPKAGDSRRPTIPDSAKTAKLSHPSLKERGRG